MTLAPGSHLGPYEIALSLPLAPYNFRTFHASTTGHRFSSLPSFFSPMLWESFLFAELILMLITGIAYWRIGKG
jgi:hypothetical protein